MYYYGQYPYQVYVDPRISLYQNWPVPPKLNVGWSPGIGGSWNQGRGGSYEFCNKFPNNYLYPIPVSGQARQSPFTLKHKQVLDLNYDGRKEVVELFAREDNGWETDWKLVVDGKEVAAFDSLNKTYKEAEMKFEYFQSLGGIKPSTLILLYFHTGSSGGTVRLRVFIMNEKNQLKEIFDNPVHDYTIDKYRFETTYLGNSEVEFIDKKYGMIGMIPLSFKDRYPELTVENIEYHLKHMQTMVDPASNYRLEYAGFDKPKDIITEQGVSGMSHADVIARFETRYSYDKKNQKYVPVKISLYSIDAKKIVAEKSI